jgi:hypothetical protein
MDADNDGWVDGLTIIHAGGGEEYSGNDTSYIWSHKWSMSSTVTYDGKSLWEYHTEPERRGWDSTPSTQGITRIGVICHENGHFLGLPDLYDYGYDSKGAGDFCLMAGGSWNGNSGTQPAHMSAWCKKELTWLTPTVITASGTYSVPRVENNQTVYRLGGTFPSTQYFLVENRQGYGFDSSLPGSTRGLLIWHVDETQANNNDQTHYKVDLEEASGTQHLELNSNEGDDADYFRLGTMTTFDYGTTPNSRSYTGAALDQDITAVSASSATMTFTVSLPDDNNPSSFSATPISSSRIDLAWGKNPANDNVMVAWNTTPTFGTPSGTYSAGNAISGGGTVLYNGSATTASHTGLTAGTTCYYKAWSVLSGPAYSSGLTCSATTTHDLQLTEGFEHAGVIPGGWTQEYVTGVASWIFQNGGYASHPASAHGGSYNALLYYAASGDHKTKLVTSAINFGAATRNAQLTFWHTMEVWTPDQDELRVYYKTSAGGSWTLLATYTTSIAAWTQQTISLPNPNSTYYIGFEGNAKYGYGVCLDDMAITADLPVAPLSPRMSITLSGTNLVINCTNGSALGTYYVLASTNLAMPWTNWPAIATNSFDGIGCSRFTNWPGANVPRRFYRLQAVP